MARGYWKLIVQRFDADPVEFVFNAPDPMSTRESREAQLGLLMSSTVCAVERIYIEATPNPRSTT